METINRLCEYPTVTRGNSTEIPEKVEGEELHTAVFLSLAPKILSWPRSYN